MAHRLNTANNGIADGALTVDVWTGPVMAYDGRPISQADSLTLEALCVIPSGKLAFAEQNEDTLTSELTISIKWERADNTSSRYSRDERSFQLYGPLHLPSSIVQAIANEADGNMLVFRQQSVYVSFCDKEGRPRVGGEDSDGFELAFVNGPSIEPQARHTIHHHHRNHQDHNTEHSLMTETRAGGHQGRPGEAVLLQLVRDPP
jgi:hypothetical protein